MLYFWSTIWRNKEIHKSIWNLKAHWQYEIYSADHNLILVDQELLDLAFWSNDLFRINFFWNNIWGEKLPRLYLNFCFVTLHYILGLKISLYFNGAFTNPTSRVSVIGTDWPLTISYFWIKAVKNLYKDILAKFSPRSQQHMLNLPYKQRYLTAVAAAIRTWNIFLLYINNQKPTFINFTILRTDISNSRNKPAGLDF